MLRHEPGALGQQVGPLGIDILEQGHEQHGENGDDGQDRPQIDRVDTVPFDSGRRADATTALAALIRRWSDHNAPTAPIRE